MVSHGRKMMRVCSFWRRSVKSSPQVKRIQRMNTLMARLMVSNSGKFPAPLLTSSILNLRAQDIDLQDIDIISQFVEESDLLCCLRLYASPVHPVSRASSSGGKPRTLYLGETPLRADGAALLARGLAYNTSLTWLSLPNTLIGDDGAISLATALTKNRHLKELSLFGGTISDSGAIALATALKKNTTLTYLGLGANDIGAAGGEAFGHALKENTTLLRLSLGGNVLRDKGAVLIAQALWTNSTLTELNLARNEINEMGMQFLRTARAYGRNQDLQMWFC